MRIRATCTNLLGAHVPTSPSHELTTNPDDGCRSPTQRREPRSKLALQALVALPPHRAPRGIGRCALWRQCVHGAIGRCGRSLNPVRVALLFDAGDHHFDRRSSSAYARKRGRLPQDVVGASQFAILALEHLQALALARRRPGTLPAIAFGLPHPPAQHLGRAAFSAMDRMAARCDGYSCACSATIRTARSRHSPGYLLGRAMGPSRGC